jgi:hypothetical protein
VSGAKLSKNQKNAISKIAILEDITCFFDEEFAIHREFVSEGRKVNAESYVGVLGRLLKRIRRVSTAKFQSSDWFLLYENALSQKPPLLRSLW